MIHTPKEKGGVCFFMKIIMRKKCRTVSAKSSAAFDRAFNEASTEIGEDVELEWEESIPMTVHMIYTERVEVPETLAEELKLRGEEYFCKEYRGRYQTLRWNGVSQERKDRRENNVSDESMAEDFERSVAALTDDDDAGRLIKMPAGGF